METKKPNEKERVASASRPLAPSPSADGAVPAVEPTAPVALAQCAAPQEDAASSVPPGASEPLRGLSSVVGAAARRLGLSENAATAVNAILEPLVEHRSVTDNVVRLIANALNRDEDVRNAEAEGYRRGRNEKIETVGRLGNEQRTQPVNFPRFRKRSFWD